MGRWLDTLLGRRPRLNIKLEYLLRLAICRLAVLAEQHHARWFSARSDLIQLLLFNQQDRALFRAELVIREQDMIDFFAIVESYCRLLIEQAFLLQRPKECPEELREAAAGISYAASRCGELPELQEVSKVLSSLFGKEFTAGAVELRNNCGVNSKMVQKLSARQPGLERRANVMKQIAMEKGIKLGFIHNLFSEDSKVDESPSSWVKTQAELMAMPRPDTASNRGDKLEMRFQVEYKDVESAAQAAFESAAYAAVAAKAAVELFRSESEQRVSCRI